MPCFKKEAKRTISSAGSTPHYFGAVKQQRHLQQTALDSMETSWAQRRRGMSYGTPRSSTKHTLHFPWVLPQETDTLSTAPRQSLYKASIHQKLPFYVRGNQGSVGRSNHPGCRV